MAEKVQERVVKHTKDELKEMQMWDLDRKIQVSKARIIEFATKFENKIYVLSSSYLIINMNHNLIFSFLIPKCQPR